MRGSNPMAGNLWGVNLWGVDSEVATNSAVAPNLIFFDVVSLFQHNLQGPELTTCIRRGPEESCPTTVTGLVRNYWSDLYVNLTELLLSTCTRSEGKRDAV